MKLNDSLLGLLLIALAIAVITHAASFPVIAGQAVPPSLFPILVGCGLFVTGLVLTAKGVRARGAMLEPDAWMRSPRLLLDMLLVVGGVAFYILFSEPLGYFLAAPLALLAFLTGTHARLVVAIPVALVVPLFIHYVFYTLLRVNLPWGLLTEYAW